MSSDLQETLWFSQGKWDVAGEAKPENRDHHVGDSSNSGLYFRFFNTLQNTLVNFHLLLWLRPDKVPLSQHYRLEREDSEKFKLFVCIICHISRLKTHPEV